MSDFETFDPAPCDVHAMSKVASHPLAPGRFGVSGSDIITDAEAVLAGIDKYGPTLVTMFTPLLSQYGAAGIASLVLNVVHTIVATTNPSPA